MSDVVYLGETFSPHGNIIGKDEQTRFQRLMWRTDTLKPLLSKADGYNYDEFNRIAEATADIYYHATSGGYYVPTGGGMCRIDEREMRKYIKKLGGPKDNG